MLLKIIKLHYIQTSLDELQADNKFRKNIDF